MFFTKAKLQSEAAVKARFIVAEKIAKSSRPFTEGELLKKMYDQDLRRLVSRQRADVGK